MPLSNDGMTRVSWVSTISNTAAPTASEINAGVALESYITVDGLDLGGDTGAMDTTPLAGGQNTEAPGRRTDTLEITMFHGASGEAGAPFTTFAARPSGYFVVRRLVANTTAFSAGQKVTVYPATVGDRWDQKPAANEPAKFKVKGFITGVVQQAVSVA